MEHFTLDPSRSWEYENGYFLTCDTSRIGKMLNHLEIYKKILHLPGDVAEFGVYKGPSLMRLLAFRHLLEQDFSRKIFGFDIFGKFPENLALAEDRAFVERFEAAGGHGIHVKELEQLIQRKGYQHVELIAGDIMETLPAFLQKEPARRFALIHIDVDVFEPTEKILALLWDKMVPGGIVMLDDYGTVAGETLAVDAFIRQHGLTLQKPPYNHIPAYFVKPL